MTSRGIVVLFVEIAMSLSLSSRDSFANLGRWLADARALASSHLVAVLVGNKSDREEDREVEWAEASRWAAENGVVYVFLVIISVCSLAFSRRSLP